MFLLSEHNIKKEHNGNRERGTFCIYALLSWPSGIRGNLYKSGLLALRKRASSWNLARPHTSAYRWNSGAGHSLSRLKREQRHVCCHHFISVGLGLESCALALFLTLLCRW